MPIVVIGLVMAPMILTSRAYASDWSNYLWMLWEQSLNVRTLGHPSYFLQSGIGAFYPQFLFYGGTLFSAAGLLAAVGGEHPLATYILTYLLALTSAYGGWLWFCRQLGLRGWRAHVPAILYVTSSYYVTNIYGRGDFGETVATSTIPLVVAGAVYLVRARRWNVTALALFAIAVVFLTGSHPLTLVWGTTFLALLAVVLLAGFSSSLRASGRRVATVLGVAALAVGVNAWILLPTLAYRDRVLHASDTVVTQLWYSTPGVLFGVLRDTANPAWITGDVQTQAPVLGIAWALLSAAACWRWAPPSTRRGLAGLVFLLGIFIWLSLSPGVLAALPKPWRNIQFPFRLVTYVTLTACAMVALVLLIIANGPSRLRRPAEAVLIVVTAISVVLATRQVWDAPSFFFKHRTEVFASAIEPPRSYYTGAAFSDAAAPIVKPTLGQLVGGTPPLARPAVELPASPYTTSHPYPIVVSQPGTVATNVATGPYLVRVRGAVPVGRTPLVPEGVLGSSFMVVRIDGKRGQREAVSFSATAPTAVRVGLIVTAASLLALAVLLIGVFVHGRQHADSARYTDPHPPSRPNAGDSA
jgi:hypothetical protein